ncbi:MAG: radical SAM protein [Chloroflexota bacterium]
MLLLRLPDTEQKIARLASEARFDLAGTDEARFDLAGAGEARGGRATEGNRVSEELGHYLHRPAGCASAPLLKVLLSDACQNSCLYCAFRAGGGRRHTAFQPEELAGAFMEMHRRGRASGIFLSSGLAGDPRRTMESMLRTVEILRHRHRFPGYIHLKILPGATEEYLHAACRLADRVSANLEAPNPGRLATLCPEKRFQDDLESSLRRVAQLRRQGPVLPFGHITQLVVGAAGESDREILETTGRLYAEADLTRAYFSAFSPLPGTPLEGHVPTQAARQRRLYQADSLLRQYGFSPEELPTGEEGNLPLDRDPKLEWALRHPERFPVEVNRAPREELLRVPGIGPKGANALLRMRKKGRLAGPEALKGLPLLLSRAAPFLLVNGRRATPDRPVQMELGL